MLSRMRRGSSKCSGMAMCVLHRNSNGQFFHTHTPDSPYLTPSHSHLLTALKDAIRGKRFGSDDKVIEEVTENIKFKLVQEGVDFVSRWPKAV